MRSADLVIKNGTIYTLNNTNPKVEAVAVQNGKIIFIGSNEEIKSCIGEKTKIIDLHGKTMTPGFIECHGHLLPLGRSKMELDLTCVTNYNELVDLVAEAVKNTKPGKWIFGFGWHQNKWNKTPDPLVNGFPTHRLLSSISPDNPVFLRHACGHAGFANAKAMEIAGVNQLSTFSDDGEIIKDTNSNPTGLFNEKAMELIINHIPEPSNDDYKQMLKHALIDCVKNGITGFHDAGCGGEVIDFYKESLKNGELIIRLYAMIDGEDKNLLKEWYTKGPNIGLGNNFLTIRSIKLLADGALGSRSAWLLEPYADSKDNKGYENIPMEYVYEVSKEGLKHGFQLCVHAIGDRANREVLNQFENVFQNNPEHAKNHRFRIEHAQHIHPKDISRFGNLGIIPSIQGIHFSSDRPWAIECLGKERIEERTHVWQKLIQSGAKVVNGSDTPVEPINPIAGFYALVTRRTLQGYPKDGYEPDHKLTRLQALRSYTLDAAYSSFEESIKGSIEIGKLADFTVFSKDIMEIDENKILNTEIEFTIVNGKIVYDKTSLNS